MSMEEYFNKNKEKLKEVYELFRNTDYGRELNLPPEFNDYNTFKTLPLIDPRKVDFKRLFVPGDNLWSFISSGVSGHRKMVMSDIGTITKYPEEMDEILRTNTSVFLHSKRRKGERRCTLHNRISPDGRMDLLSIRKGYRSRKNISREY